MCTSCTAAALGLSCITISNGYLPPGRLALLGASLMSFIPAWALKATWLARPFWNTRWQDVPRVGALALRIPSSSMSL